MTRRLHFLLTAAILLGFLLTPPTLIRAQEEPAAASPAQPDGDDKTIREQSIYIPYEELRNVFEQHGRGVFLPYEQFQKLWEAARDDTRPAAEQKPPVGALISEIVNEATVEKDVVKVKALVKIEVLAEGWNEIPLRLGSAAILSATLEGRPARITGGGNRGYKLLLEKKGKQPEQFELSLEYAKAIVKNPGRNSVEFQSPLAPVSRWEVRIPQSGVKVEVKPMIATTAVPPPGDGAPQPDETVVRAFVGAAPSVQIEWTPKAEGAMGLDAMASVETEQQVHIDEGVIRTQTRLVYTISRAELSQLVIEVPADQKVVGLTDANVRQWTLKADGDKQQIVADLFEPAKRSQVVLLELKKFAASRPEDAAGEDPAVTPSNDVPVEVPIVRAVGVGRQQGTVVVRLETGLRAEVVRAVGMLQRDAAELPKSLAGKSWDFSYRYATVPYGLALRIEKVQPRILADSLIEAYLQPDRISMNMLTVFTVQRAGIFRLEFDLPAGYRIRNVRGRDVKAAGAKAVLVDNRVTEGDDNTRLIVNLQRKAFGRVALAIELEKDLDRPELLSPTGTQVDVPLPLPRVAPGTVEQDSGRLVVFAPESLSVSAETSSALREISLSEAVRGIGSYGRPATSDARPVLQQAFSEEPVELVLAARHRKPHVNIRQMLVARVDNGTVKYEATFVYEILYSGVKSLQIDVPVSPDATDAAAGWRNVTDKIHHTVLDPASQRPSLPAALPPDAQPPDEGYERWSFTGETELFGTGRIQLAWDAEIGQLDSGKPVKLDVPRLVPVGVDLARGQIVLTKSETIDLAEADNATGLQRIDPRDLFRDHPKDLFADVRPADAARAFEFHGDWSLAVIATQYELEEVKRTSIDRAVARMVVTRADRISVQALYRMRSVRQRIQVQLPTEAQFDTVPARIDGQPVTLQSEKSTKKETKLYFVPLVGLQQGEPFLLELRYTVSGDGTRLALPVFPEEPAVQKVYLCAYLPEEWALLGTGSFPAGDAGGPWAAEFRWRRPTGSLNWIPVPRPVKGGQLMDAKYLLNWVGLDADEAAEFQTDGRLHVFSTPLPAASPDGDLTIRAMDRTWLNVLVFAATLIGGLLLLPAGISQRAMAVGVSIVTLVLCGVFLPTFALQILDGELALALFIVFVVWTVWYVARTLPARLRVAGPLVPPVPPPLPSFTEPSRHGPDLNTEEEPPAEEPPAEEKAKPTDSASDEGGPSND